MNTLPQKYKEALQAMKEQAGAATTQLVSGDRQAQHAELGNAQKRMAQYPRETRLIYQLLMTSKDKTLTIETLDEQRLAEEFGFV